MFAVFAAVFCLMSVSRSAPIDCQSLVRPLDQLDPHHLEGRWALVASSLTDKQDAENQKGRDSISFDYHNSTYTQAIRYDVQCQFIKRNISLEGSNFSFVVAMFNFTGTFFQTSCQDCVVFRLNTEGPNYSSVEFHLLSRRRAVEQQQMDEFKAQVECVKMPPPIVMDPTKELCPKPSTSSSSQ